MPQRADASARRSTSSACARDFPILAQHGPRQAARLPRQRRDDAEAARGHRRDRALLQRRNANVHRGVHTLSQRATEAYEARARQGAALHQRRATRARSSSRAARPRRSTSSRRATARPRLKPGDEILISAMEHHSNIVPWQIVCEQTGATLARRSRSTDAGELDLDEFATPARRRARSIVAITHVSNALGTINPVAEHHRAGARARAPVLLDGAQAVAAPARSTCRRSAATSTPSPATRSTARPASACCTASARAARGDAAVPGRRRHDPLGHASRRRPTRAAVQVRGRHAEHRRRRRTRRRRSTTSTRSASSASRAHEHELLEYATERVLARFRRCGSSARRARRRPCSPSCSTASTRTTSARSRPRRHRRPHRPPLRQPVMERFSVPATRARRSPSTTRARRSIGSWTRCTPCGRCSAVMELQGPLPGTDPRPQPQPAELPRAGRRRIAAEGFNPLCGDKLTLYLDMDGDRSRTSSFEGPAAPSPRRPPR